MLHISNKDILVEYLKDKGLIKENETYKIHYCNGGVSCTVAYVETKDKAMIVKQALEQLKTKETWLCDPNRMNIEYESNKIYYDLLPDDAPETYFYDKENYIYGREAVPDGCFMWKDYLMKQEIDLDIAKKAAHTLVTVHNECYRKEDIKNTFKDKNVFYALRISPYIEFTATKHTEIMEQAKEVSKLLMDSEITLIHGDYSPKNIMIWDKKIKVLDFEVATYGHPAFDLAFFINHFILKAIKFNNTKFLMAADEIFKVYMNELTCMDKKEFEKDFSRLLAFLMLARVDGKSPVEYLVGEDDKQELVRKISLYTITNRLYKYEKIRSILDDEIK